MDIIGSLIPKDKREPLEAQAMERITQARVNLVRGKLKGNEVSPRAIYAFFAILCMRLTPKIDWTQPTACTDGRSIWYNPMFLAELTDEELVAVVAHECMHPALAHNTRRGHRDPRRWNIAADAAINPMLDKDGFKLPGHCIFPGRPMPLKKGEQSALTPEERKAIETAPPFESAEYYYYLLRDLPPYKGPGSGDGQGKAGKGGGGTMAGDDPGGCGAVKDVAGADAAPCETEWRGAVARAVQIMKQRGTLPAGLEHMVDEILEPKISWKTLLANFVTAQMKDDYTWRRPNRRHIHSDTYLPTVYGESIGDLVVAIDTSGSCYCDETLGRFFGEVNGILEAYDCSLKIMYADCAVHKVEEWSSKEGRIPAALARAVGGGGTSHKPVFEYIEKQDWNPVAVICLTDLCTDFPEAAPTKFPVMWAVVDNPKAEAPFGVTIHVEKDEIGE